MSTLPRLLGPLFQRARAGFPAVLVTGPRQSGKTTFLRSECGSDAVYVSFDDPRERELARHDPRALLARGHERPLILDEIQYAPELLPWVKMAIDAERGRAGRFLITGSQQFALMANVSESLAGRVAILELYPFSALELPRAPTLSEFAWGGGYPEPALQPSRRDLWLSSYLQTYVQRDLRQLRDVSDLLAFERFVGLLAARHGQELNYADLGRDAGVSGPTARAWISALAASYVVVLVPAWHDNLGKRLVKAPKLYFVDPALVAWLTRLPDPASALASPLGGALVEGIVVTETLKLLAAAGGGARVWHYRATSSLEVDLLVQVGAELWAVEVKRTSTPTRHHADGLRRFRQIEGSVSGCIVACDAPEPVELGDGIRALPWLSWSEWLRGRLSLGDRPA